MGNDVCQALKRMGYDREDREFVAEEVAAEAALAYAVEEADREAVETAACFI